MRLQFEAHENKGCIALSQKSLTEDTTEKHLYVSVIYHKESV